MLMPLCQISACVACMQMSVEAVKIKLGSHCGTAASDMILQLKDSSGRLVAVLSEPHRKLGFYSPEDGWVECPCIVPNGSKQCSRPEVSLSQVRCSTCAMIICRMVLHVIDTNPNSLSARGWLEDTSKVQKYVMSDADYNARENTYRKYKEQKLKVRVNCPQYTCQTPLPTGTCR